jgi:hypothetical protein
MDASTLKYAADTVTDKLTPVADTVASKLAPAADTVFDKLTPVADTVVDKLAPVSDTISDKLGEFGDVAFKLAALTPWVEPRTRRNLSVWVWRIGAVAAVAAVVLWWAKRRSAKAGYEPQATVDAEPSPAERHLTAAAGD